MKGRLIVLLNDHYYHYHHEVTPLTMAVIPTDSSLRKQSSSLLLEETGERTAEYYPTQLIDLSCKSYGSSLKGRLEGTASIASITHKPPIIIDSPFGMAFFPTASPYHPACIWLSHVHIERIVENTSNGTDVYFVNGKIITLDVSFHSLENQLSRAAQFRFALENRLTISKKKTKRKQFINPFAKQYEESIVDEHIFQIES